MQEISKHKIFRLFDCNWKKNTNYIRGLPLGLYFWNYVILYLHSYLDKF